MDHLHPAVIECVGKSAQIRLQIKRPELQTPVSYTVSCDSVHSDVHTDYVETWAETAQLVLTKGGRDLAQLQIIQLRLLRCWRLIGLVSSRQFPGFHQLCRRRLVREYMWSHTSLDHHRLRRLLLHLALRHWRSLIAQSEQIAVEVILPALLIILLLKLRPLVTVCYAAQDV